jgi:RNA polymerase sigma factor (sigma-70 family)
MSKVLSLLTPQDYKNLDESVYAALYKSSWLEVRRYILYNSGDEEEAQDIFHDAIIEFIKNVQKPDFTFSAAPGTYLYQIAKFQWLKRLKKIGKNISWQDNESEDDMYETGMTINFIAEQYTQNESKNDDDSEDLPSIEAMLLGLENLGNPCHDILTKFYLFEIPREELAKQYQMTLNTMSVKKKRCLEALRKLIS